MTTTTRNYNEDGLRMTDCCGALSTYHDDDLCCKVCWESVGPGEGDGSESMPALTVSLTRTRSASVADLSSASIAVRADIEGRGRIGNGAWSRALGTLNGAPVIDPSGVLVAHVSYNGRVWALDGSEVTL